MKKIIGLFLLFSSFSCYAEWTRIKTTDEYIAYYDKENIKTVSGYKRVWVLVNFKNSKQYDGKEFLSQRTYEEYDCNEEKMRTLSGAIFVNRFADGGTLWQTNKPDGWSYLAPNTNGKDLMNLVCK